MKKYRDIVPEEVGTASDSVYSISDVEKSLEAKEAMAAVKVDDEN